MILGFRQKILRHNVVVADVLVLFTVFKKFVNVFFDQNKHFIH